MRPQNTNSESETLSFSTKLENILSNKYPLYILANKIDWSFFEKSYGKLYHEKVGRPGLPIRLLVGLHYLKYAYDISDEGVVEQFSRIRIGNIFAVMNIFSITFPAILHRL